MPKHLSCGLIAAMLLFLTSCAGCPVADTAHHSRNSLDWAGDYRGVLPCADCEGIETRLTLNRNQTYLIQTRYLGKPGNVFRADGVFTWDATGNRITLTGEEKRQYQLGENSLKQLDMSGNPIAGGLAEHYVLQKVIY